MKRFTVVLAMLLCITSLSVNAQKMKVKSAKSFFEQGLLDKAKTYVDEGIQDPACQTWFEAFLIKGQIYQSIFQHPLYSGLSDQPLETAWEAYQKAVELDVKGKKTKKELPQRYADLIIQFTNQGADAFNGGNHAKALQDFNRVLEIHASPYGDQKTDTLVTYYAALSALQSGNDEQAVPLFNKCIELNYETARCYASIATIIRGQSKKLAEAGDSIAAKAKDNEALNILLEGHEKYPTDIFMLVELINYYLLGDNPGEAEVFLDAAIAENPDNSDYVRAKGTLFEKLGRPDDAELWYGKALEINPKDFYAQYGIGVIKYNKVILHHNEVNQIQDFNEYDKQLEVVMQEYESLIPYFEKALELDPDDFNTKTALKELYFRLRNRNDNFEKRYNEVKAMLE